MESHRFQH